MGGLLLIQGRYGTSGGNKRIGYRPQKGDEAPGEEHEDCAIQEPVHEAAGEGNGKGG
jgi:hypothetical protein